MSATQKNETKMREFVFDLGMYMATDAVPVEQVGGVLSGGRNARRCFSQLTNVAIDIEKGVLLDSTDAKKIDSWEGLTIVVPDHILLVTTSFLTALIKPWWEHSRLSRARKTGKVRIQCEGTSEKLQARQFVVQKKLANSLDNLSLLGGYEATAGEHSSYLRDLGLVAG